MTNVIDFASRKSRPRVDFEECRRMLVAVLTRPNERPVAPKSMSDADLLFVTATCAAKIIEHTICAIAGDHKELALDGLNSLVTTMRANIAEICDAAR